MLGFQGEESLGSNGLGFVLFVWSLRSHSAVGVDRLCRPQGGFRLQCPCNCDCVCGGLNTDCFTNIVIPRSWSSKGIGYLA